MLKRAWEYLSNTGVKANQPPSVARYIVLTNRFGLISMLVALVVLIYILSIDPVDQWILGSHPWIFLSALACLGALKLNQLGYYNSAKWLISWVVPLIVLTISIFEKKMRAEFLTMQDYYSFRFLLMASSVIPILVFNTRDKWQLLLNLLASLVGCIFFNPIHILFGVGMHDLGFQDSKILMLDLIVALSYLAFIGFLLNQRRIFDKNEFQLYENQKNLEEKNKELLHMNAFINDQNTEMNAQSDKLWESHDALIVASRTIERQKHLLEKQNKTLEIQVAAKTKELSKINEELIINNNELRQFSHTLSHNLKSPVATFQGLLNLMKANELSAENKQLFSYLNDSVQKMQGVFHDMNEMLELRNSLYNTIEDVDLQKQIDDLHGYFYPELNANNILLTYDLNGGRMIMSNEKRLQSIMFHLISNAIKFKSPLKRPTVHITAHNGTKHHSIIVEDNGIGIDLTKYRDKLFYPYQRFHNPSSGKGLGLYLVKVQAESLGGRVFLDSKPNEYTRVEVQLQK